MAEWQREPDKGERLQPKDNGKSFNTGWVAPIRMSRGCNGWVRAQYNESKQTSRVLTVRGRAEGSSAVLETNYKLLIRAMTTTGQVLEAGSLRADAGLGLVLWSPMLKERTKNERAKRPTAPRALELEKRR